MRGHFEYQYRLADLGVESALKHQCTDAQNPMYGAALSTVRTYFGAEDGTGILRVFLVAYYCEGSKYYRNDELLERSFLALDFAARQQKSDGTFDLKETNFHDGAQTAFIVSGLAPAVLLMKNKSRHTEAEDRLYGQLIAFISRCADGMLNGGFHTPNHRWVISSALCMCHALTGREDCLDKMRLFLNEGIDCDEEGEFTERSSGIYNRICDRAFIFLAFVGGMTELYGIVSRNLHLVLKYIEPDLTVNTMNSTRQDAGTMPDWRIYYDLYLFMALKTGDREFRYIADRMLEQSRSRLSPAGIMAGEGFAPWFEYLPLALTDESLMREWDESETARPPYDFTRFFRDSGIVRHRKNRFSLTLVSNNPSFALLKFGRHNVYLRMAGTFYAQGQFEAEQLEQTGEGYRMVYRRRWGYKSPLPEKQETSDWRRIDHSKRRDVMMQDFVFNVDVRILENGAAFHVTTEGVEDVLVKFEILLEAGSGYRTPDIYTRTKNGDYILQSADEAVYEYDDGAKLFIDGGTVVHRFAERMRGSLFGDPARFTVAMTAATPMDHVFTLTFTE